MNRFLLIVLIFVMYSCGDDYAIKHRSLYVADENRDWVIPDDYGSGFVMTDNNRISQSFIMTTNTTDFSPSTSYFLVIRTRITNTESFTQGYTSNYGSSHMFILTAGFEPYGDRISISINGLNFQYDFKLKTIGRIDYLSNYKYRVMTDMGYQDGDSIYSSVEILDSYPLNSIDYAGVLHFKFEDFPDLWTDFTVTELYVAKKYGLIKYTLKNGITYER